MLIRICGGHYIKSNAKVHGVTCSAMAPPVWRMGRIWTKCHQSCAMIGGLDSFIPGGFLMHIKHHMGVRHKRRLLCHHPKTKQHRLFLIWKETEETAINPQLEESTVVSSIILETKVSATGHWIFRASHQAVKYGKVMRKCSCWRNLILTAKYFGYASLSLPSMAASDGRESGHVCIDVPQLLHLYAHSDFEKKIFA